MSKKSTSLLVPHPPTMITTIGCAPISNIAYPKIRRVPCYKPCMARNGPKTFWNQFYFPWN